MWLFKIYELLNFNLTKLHIARYVTQHYVFIIIITRILAAIFVIVNNKSHKLYSINIIAIRYIMLTIMYDGDIFFCVDSIGTYLNVF